MGFWNELWKDFNKDDNWVVIEKTEWRMTSDRGNEMKQLKGEIAELKRQLGMRKINAIESKVKLLE